MPHDINDKPNEESVRAVEKIISCGLISRKFNLVEYVQRNSSDLQVKDLQKFCYFAAYLAPNSCERYVKAILAVAELRIELFKMLEHIDYLRLFLLLDKEKNSVQLIAKELFNRFYQCGEDNSFIKSLIVGGVNSLDYYSHHNSKHRWFELNRFSEQATFLTIIEVYRAIPEKFFYNDPAIAKWFETCLLGSIKKLVYLPEESIEKEHLNMLIRVIAHFGSTLQEASLSPLACFLHYKPELMSQYHTQRLFRNNFKHLQDKIIKLKALELISKHAPLAINQNQLEYINAFKEDSDDSIQILTNNIINACKNADFSQAGHLASFRIFSKNLPQDQVNSVSEKIGSVPQ